MVVEVDGSGDVYVSDTANYRVQKFNNNGGFLTQWGSLGTNDDQFQGPRGIAFDKDGSVYVVDQPPSWIKKFTPDGQFLLKFGGTAKVMVFLIARRMSPLIQMGTSSSPTRSITVSRSSGPHRSP